VLSGRVAVSSDSCLFVEAFNASVRHELTT